MDSTKAYQVFVRAVEVGSFSAVAREMGTTQSSISKIIASLESSLGVQLFARTTRKLHPTDEALQLYEHARQLLDTVDTLTSASRKTQKAEASGLLRLTIPHSYGRRRLMPLLAQFIERYPKVKLDIVMKDDIVDLIGEGLELGVRIGTLPSNTLIARSLGIVEYTTVATARYLERHGRPESPLDLAQHGCIVSGTHNRWHFESEHGRHSVEVSGPIRINDAESILQAVQADLGIAQIPDWIIRSDFAAHGLVPLLDEYYPIPQPVSIVYPQTRFLTQRARSLIDFLVAEKRNG
ncbi:MAG: LysR family transcriptional regulator [Gammaproteobacteria bacterium]|nr:LysR family transcriptional regulator [Gammaproteobacteria bacterium]